MQDSRNSSGFGSLSGFVYTHNPFYLISALLVLIGMHQALAANASITGGWLLVGVLCGYTLLLMLAGIVIVRFGQVWEDARTILLVIVLLFVALSISFDKIVLESPHIGARFLLFGFWFAFGISEGVFGGLGIRLTARYRVPYYLVLALLFGYPLGLGQLSVSGNDRAMAWGVFLFPLIGASVLLALWPAARGRGRDEPVNGTPWSWPGFPWVLFLFLFLAIGLRSYSLSMAFESFKGSAVSFRPYFLAPLLLVGALLLLEIAIANDFRRAKWFAMALPLAVLAMSFPGASLNPAAERFLRMLTQAAGSPVQLGLIGVTVFYALAWLRGMQIGELGLLLCAAMACVVDRQTVDWDTFSAVQWQLLLAIAVIELLLGAWRRSSWRVIVAVAAGAGAVRTGGWAPNVSSDAHYILGHATAILALLAAAFCKDRWAQIVRRLAVLLIPVAACIAATGYESIFPQIPRGFHAAYLSGLGVVAWLYWRQAPGTAQLLAILITVLSLATLGSRGLYLVLQSSPLKKGLPWLAGGLAAFAVAMLQSFLKGGLITRGWRLLRSTNKP